jgi:hypothetical protein
MKIYYNLIPIEDIPNFVRSRDGAYMNRLIGVNYWKDNEDRIRVEPVYKPVLAGGRSAGQIWCDIYLKDGVLRIILQRRSPRIQIRMYDIVMEKDDEE